MEDSFKNTLTAFILMALFGMLVLTVVVTVGNDYDKDTSTTVAGSLSLNKFNNSISNVEQNAKELQDRFTKGSIWSSIAGIVVNGIFGIAKDMLDMIFSGFNLLANISIDVFQVPVWVTSVVLGVLILSLILGIWALLKVGN